MKIEFIRQILTGYIQRDAYGHEFWDVGKLRAFNIHSDVNLRNSFWSLHADEGAKKVCKYSSASNCLWGRKFEEDGK